MTSKISAVKSQRLCHESSDDVTSLATRRSYVTKTFWKSVLSEWIRMVITRFVYEWFAGINCIVFKRLSNCSPLKSTLASVWSQFYTADVKWASPLADIMAEQRARGSNWAAKVKICRAVCWCLCRCHITTFNASVCPTCRTRCKHAGVSRIS